MITASNFIKTNNIDRVTSGILTIGGTSVSMPDTTTDDLTVTGRITSEIQTTTITPSYVTYPTQDTTQRAFQLYNSVTTAQSSNPISRLNVITTVISNATTGTLVTIPLPIGVWSISYTVRFASANSTTPATPTYLMATATLDEPVTYNGIVYPKYLGLQAIPIPITVTGLVIQTRVGLSGNTIITNNV